MGCLEVLGFDWNGEQGRERDRRTAWEAREVWMAWGADSASPESWTLELETGCWRTLEGRILLRLWS